MWAEWTVPAVRPLNITRKCPLLFEVCFRTFQVQLRDGRTVTADFGTGDVLVFMLGDGVNQFFNAKYRSGPGLYATPHSFTMPSAAEAVARAWYGRMILPPADALSEQHGLSYGKMRDLTQKNLREQGPSDAAEADAMEVHLCFWGGAQAS